MSGASPRSLPVEYVNANWVPGKKGRAGSFRLMVVTTDGRRTTMRLHPDEVGPVVALCSAPTRLLWDPDHRTLIVTGIVGDWLGEGSPSCRGQSRGVPPR